MNILKVHGKGSLEMKKFFAITLTSIFLTACISIALPIGIYAERYTMTDENGETLAKFDYDVVDGYAVITDVNAIQTDALVFPAEMDGYPVKTVSGIYFTNKDEKTRAKIKSITFEDGIEKIDQCGFDFAENLTSLRLPNTLKEGEFIFRECPSLESVNIPSTLKEIPEMCFFDCTSLKEVHIEDGVQAVGVSAFGDCKNLTDVELPDSVLYIKNSAFKSCENLKNVNLPKNLEYIGEYAFYKTGIEQINLPSKLKEINEQAFGYTPLKEIKLPDSLESIGYETFKGCKSLTKAYIPKSVMNKPNNAFYACDNLSKITFGGEITKELYDQLAGTAWGQEYQKTVEDEFVIFDGNYLAAYNGTDKNPVIPDSVTVLGDRAFRNSDIDTVTFSPNIKVIPAMCFAGSHIKELTVPKTIEKVEERAFYSCAELEKLTVEDGVKSIAGNAFQLCTKLSGESVNIAKSVNASPAAFTDTPLDKNLDINTKPQTTPTPAPKTLEVNGADMSISVDGRAVDFPDAKPFVDDNDRTQVPIRAVAEMLNCSVDWNGDTKTATVTREGGDVITLRYGSDVMTVNGKDVKMDTSVIIKNDRTYIPVRFVAETLGLAVEWK